MKSSNATGLFVLIVVICFVIVGLAFCSAGASAQGSVPTNGCFSGSLYGWATYARGSSGWSGSGHGSCGAYVMRASNGWIQSLPMLLGSGSSLSIWTYVSAAAPHFTIWVLDYDAGNFWQGTQYTLGSTNVWVNETYDLSTWAGHRVSLRLFSQDAGAVNISFSDISVSNASAVSDIYTPGYFNGTFTASTVPWVFGVALDGSVRSWGWSATVGNAGLGSAFFQQFASVDDGGFSYPFRADGQSWTTSYYGASDSTSNTVDVRVLDYGRPGYSGSDLTSVTDLTVRYNLANKWSTFNFNPSAWNGNTIGLYVGSDANGNYGDNVYIDDVCPFAGCGVGTPTATPVGTATPSGGGFPYGAGTPVPVLATINWNSFPTQIPYATPLYGAGTAIPVYWLTPMPVTVTNLTPFPYGAGTPIPVQFPTPVVTPFSAANNQSGGVTLGTSSTYYDTSTASGVIPIGGGSGNMAMVVDFKLMHQNLHFCLPSQLSNIISNLPCVDLDMIYVDHFTLLGYDFLPVVGVIMLALFIVFVIRQIQTR